MGCWTSKSWVSNCKTFMMIYKVIEITLYTLSRVNSGNRTPVLAYAIAHNSGTVWCLEWCPSGCYQDTELGNYKAGENKPRRMGLLAAACSDGCIDIYSLPFPDELEFEKTEHNSWVILRFCLHIIISLSVIRKIFYAICIQGGRFTRPIR